MQGKNIRVHLNKKINDWINSIDDENIQSVIQDNVIVTGGAIVSLLQDEDPRDYDVYFRTADSLKTVIEYYLKKYIEKVGSDCNYDPTLQRCKWDNKSNRWVVLEDDQHADDERLRIFIRSAGAAGIGFDNYSETDMEYKQAIAKLNTQVKEKVKEDKEPLPPYFPVFMTNNAMTLSNKIQIVLRFFGEPEEIHKNYDFVHCTSYWTSWNDHLEMPARALEAIINKELYYMGSKYPLCSIIRTRKFMKRGWTINAGQYVKMVLQLNDLDLKNLHIFEEQLIGVDSAYFNAFITSIEKMKQNDPDFSMDTEYLIKLLNNVFDDGDAPKDLEETE